MNDWLEDYINESWIEPTWLDIAEDWHSGSGSMLYAVSSTGSITLGSVRPLGDDGPMTDVEWYRSLLFSLSCELDVVIRAMERLCEACDREEGLSPEEVFETCSYDVSDVRAFRDAVDDRIVFLDSE